MTVSGVPDTVTLCPTGLPTRNSSEAVSGPSTTTSAAASTSAWVKNRPTDRSRARTSVQDVVVPTNEVVQLVSPLTSETLEEVVGATAATSGATFSSSMVWASATVSVDAEPKPPRCPEESVVLPGETMSRLEPRALIWSSTSCCAPSPSPTVRITELMPMTIPSIVSIERSRWARMASTAARRVSVQLIGWHPRAGRSCRR